MREIKKGEIWGIQRMKMYVVIVSVKPNGKDQDVKYIPYRGNRRKTYIDNSTLFMTVYKKVRYVKQ